MIEDVSDYQDRPPNPQIGIVSTLFSPLGGRRIDDPGEDQGAPVHRHHRRGGRRERRGRLGGRVCPGGVSFGFPQIVDVADPTHPRSSRSSGWK